MKKLVLFATGMLITTLIFARQTGNKEKKPIEQIRKYWFVLLKTGPNTARDSATGVKLQEGHLANITRLYEEGKIKVAGPFGEKGDWRGIFIFDAETKEEVEKLLQSDPAIAAGTLAYEIKPWYTAPIGSFVPGKPKKE
jgi:uncharacterized protein YciI